MARLAATTRHRFWMLTLFALAVAVAVAVAVGDARTARADAARLWLVQDGPAENVPARRNRLDWPSAWQPITSPDAAPSSQTGAAAGQTEAPSAQPGASVAGQAPISGGSAGPPPAAADATAGAEPQSAPLTAQGLGTERSGGTEAKPQPNGTALELKAANDQEAKPAPESPRPAALEAKESDKVVNVEEDELPADLRRALQPVDTIDKRLETLKKTVERVKGRDSELTKLQPQIEDLIVQAVGEADSLRPRLADIKSQIAKISPAPDAKDTAPESAEIAAKRRQLNEIQAAIDGAIKKAELLAVQGRQLVGRLQSLRQSIFAQETFRRSTSPLNPSVFGAAVNEVPGLASQVSSIWRQWFSNAVRQGWDVAAVLIAAIIGYVLARILAHRVLLSRLNVVREPPVFFEKAVAAGLFTPLVALPYALSAAIIYFGFERLGLIYLQAGTFLRLALIGGVVWEVVSSLARAYLQPYRPLWRIAEVDDDAARRLYRIVQALAAVFVLDIVLREMFAALFAGLPLRIFTTFLMSLAYAGLFLLIARTPLPKAQSLTAGLLTGIQPELLKLPFLLAAVFIAVASAIGYVALARYVAGQLILTGSALLLIAVLFVSIRAIAQQPDHLEASGQGDGLSGALSLTPDQNRRLVQIISLALYCGLALLAPVLLLFSFGYSWVEISSVIDRALFGFEVGGVRISLLKVALAFGLFAGILLLTRTVQSGLSNSVLTPERTDPGLANSIKTGVGYFGFAIAALAALSYAGLDITNLAIVAGALSVGIGFGLQSIVNNFVSGLILLVERPVKVGDWIQVGSSQGYVRRISVRSTEIETFERASVIIPNSELITGSVTNLTHRNALGRLQINVGVSYASDPEQVQAILMEAAKECALVARHPPAFVVFEDFGDSALLFSLRAYVTDINKGLSTQTALRTAIFKKLRAADIEIPFPQRDLHLRDLDGVRGMIARAAEERMRRAGDAATSVNGETKTAASASGSGQVG